MGDMKYHSLQVIVRELVKANGVLDVVAAARDACDAEENLHREMRDAGGVMYWQTRVEWLDKAYKAIEGHAYEQAMQA